MASDTELLALCAWLSTYALHSTVLIGAAWLATRVSARLRSNRGAAVVIRERIWRTALLAGIATASVQVATGVAPLQMRWTIVAAPAPAPLAVLPAVAAAEPRIDRELPIAQTLRTPARTAIEPIAVERTPPEEDTAAASVASVCSRGCGWPQQSARRRAPRDAPLDRRMAAALRAACAGARRSRMDPRAPSSTSCVGAPECALACGSPAPRASPCRSRSACAAARSAYRRKQLARCSARSSRRCSRTSSRMPYGATAPG